MTAAVKEVQPWESCFDKDGGHYVSEKKEVITKVEYRNKNRYEKREEVKMLAFKRRVTKGYLDRQKLKPFGIGKTEDDIRQNITITSVQKGKYGMD